MTDDDEQRAAAPVVGWLRDDRIVGDHRDPVAIRGGATPDRRLRSAYIATTSVAALDAAFDELEAAHRGCPYGQLELFDY